MKKKKIFSFSLALLFLATSLFLFEKALYSQTEDVSQMKQRITDLENKIKDLEARLGKCIERTEMGKTTDLGWQNKMNWRRLEMGMTETRVRSILGEPTKVIMGIKTLWYYPNIYGGYVSFNTDGSLAGWKEP